MSIAPSNTRMEPRGKPFSVIFDYDPNLQRDEVIAKDIARQAPVSLQELVKKEGKWTYDLSERGPDVWITDHSSKSNLHAVQLYEYLE